MTSFEDNHPGLKGKGAVFYEGSSKPDSMLLDVEDYDLYFRRDDVAATQIDKTIVRKELDKLSAIAHNEHHLTWREIEEAIEGLGL